MPAKPSSTRRRPTSPKVSAAARAREARKRAEADAASRSGQRMAEIRDERREDRDVQEERLASAVEDAVESVFRRFGMIPLLQQPIGFSGSPPIGRRELDPDSIAKQEAQATIRRGYDDGPEPDDDPPGIHREQDLAMSIEPFGFGPIGERLDELQKALVDAHEQARRLELLLTPALLPDDEEGQPDQDRAMSSVPLHAAMERQTAGTHHLARAGRAIKNRTFGRRRVAAAEKQLQAPAGPGPSVEAVQKAKATVAGR